MVYLIDITLFDENFMYKIILSSQLLYFMNRKNFQLLGEYDYKVFLTMKSTADLYWGKIKLTRASFCEIPVRSNNVIQLKDLIDERLQKIQKEEEEIHKEEELLKKENNELAIILFVCCCFFFFCF